MSTTVSVVLPTYNEAATIAPLIADIFIAIGDDGEVIVVDDDSPDGTWRLAEAAAQNDRRIRVIRRRNRPGLTASLAEGIQAASGDIVVWMDADYSHPPATIAALVTAVEKGDDLAIASRYVAGGADRRDVPLHRLLSRVITSLATRLIDPRVRDYTSGFAAGRQEKIAAVRLAGDYGEYFIDLVARALRRGWRVVEVPYVNEPRRSGASKTATTWWGFIRRGWPYLRTVFRLAGGPNRTTRESAP